MRKIVYPIIVIATIYTAHFAVDLFIPTITTDEDRILAQEYLDSKNLPTPDKEFSRDGCTLWPDKLPGHDFTEPCLTHDIAYWAGGDTELQRAANQSFKTAIVKTGPIGFVLSPIMYIGVEYLGNNGVSRTVGSHWGFGWN